MLNKMHEKKEPHYRTIVGAPVKKTVFCQNKHCATGCHFTGPIALRPRLSPVLLNIQLCIHSKRLLLLQALLLISIIYRFPCLCQHKQRRFHTFPAALCRFFYIKPTGSTRPPAVSLRKRLHLPVQCPVLQRLGEMGGVQHLVPGQVGDGAGHPQDAVIGTGAVAQALKGGA